jgi:hypothetical protein
MPWISFHISLLPLSTSLATAVLFRSMTVSMDIASFYALFESGFPRKPAFWKVSASANPRGDAGLAGGRRRGQSVHFGAIQAIVFLWNLHSVVL